MNSASHHLLSRYWLPSKFRSSVVSSSGPIIVPSTTWHLHLVCEALFLDFFFMPYFFCPNWFEGIDCSQLYMLIRSLDILLLCNWNMTPPFLWMRKPCPSEGTFSPWGMTYLFGIQIVLVWQHWRRALGLILTDLGPGGTEVRQGEDVTWGPGQTPLSWLPCRWWLGPLEHESPGTHNDDLLQRLYLNSPDAPTPDRVPSLD